MAYEQRDMSGSIFKNTRKENDKQPTMTGSAMIGGVEYWVSGWTKVDKNHEKWVSLAFKEKQPAGEKPAAKTSYDTDDEIPF
jgi:hypothetical protein